MKETKREQLLVSILPKDMPCVSSGIAERQSLNCFPLTKDSLRHLSGAIDGVMVEASQQIVLLLRHLMQIRGQCVASGSRERAPLA
jgi:hypothetical protein